MVQTESGPRRSQSDDEPDVISESRSLQRKLVFWRRTAGLLLGLALVVMIVFWQRAELHRKACAEALMCYTRLAQDAHLEDQPAHLLKAQWDSLRAEPRAVSSSISPEHYSLIIENWGQKPRPGEALPLAVCNDAHLGIIAQGRHVLLRDSNGYRIEWVSEDQVGPILAAARADQYKR